MPGLKSLMKDSVTIAKADGRRFGPFQAAVAAASITIMERELDVDEGDHVLRSIPGGKEETYRVLEVQYHHGLHTIPPSYTLKVQKTTAIVPAASSQRNTTIHISNSTGVQVGDYNTQHFQATFNELYQRIEQSSAPAEQKAEAHGRLAALLAHPLVFSVLGGAVGSWVDAAAGGG